MRKIDADDIRACGLIPCGHYNNKNAQQLFNRLSEKYQTIKVAYEHCLNAQKRQWEWRIYRFVGLDNNDCLLRQICYKPLSEEKKSLLKQKMLNNEEINPEDFNQEEYLSEEITKINAADVCNCHDAYMARIEVE